MNNFEHTITQMYGTRGNNWLRSLPSTIELLAAQWNLSSLQVLRNLSYSYVLSGMQKNVAIVLKLCYDRRALQKEVDCLHYFTGHGSVKLLDYDETKKALLLEQAIPGTSLKEFFATQEEVAVGIVSQLIHKIHKAPQPNWRQFPHVAQWLSTLDNKWNIPGPHLAKARLLASDLLATSTEQILLHGDLHHNNIISHNQTWLAIDPKGVIGEPTYEIGAFIRNPMPELVARKDAYTIIKRRLTLCADMRNFDQERIAQGSYVQSVVAACWCIEDKQDPQPWIAYCSLIDCI